MEHQENVREIFVRLQNAHDTEENWVANNPVLYEGEFAVSHDNLNNLVGIKVGNGVDSYNNLTFINGITPPQL